MTQRLVDPAHPKLKRRAPRARIDAEPARFQDCIHGDCLEQLKLMEADSVHAIVTDPPAGISLLGKEWDGDKGGRDQWIAWLTAIMCECLRVLKPGGHAVVWALPRTSHWTATAIENAGFEVRDVITHHFGCGWPKGQDPARLIDKRVGIEREVIGQSAGKWGESKGDEVSTGLGATFAVTAPATADAKRWAGWNTALKPASEHWVLARKPLAFDMGVNVKRNGTGAINIDDTRVPLDGEKPSEFKFSASQLKKSWVGDKTKKASAGLTWQSHPGGRWPANLVLTHSPGCTKEGSNGKATFACEPGCPVSVLNMQSAGDEVSRYFNRFEVDPREVDFLYQAKASVAEKKRGIEENLHPTVKSVALMEHFVKLTTRPGQVVLDPFAGSGTTLIAAKRLGRSAIGIERDYDYWKTIRARLEKGAYW